MSGACRQCRGSGAHLVIRVGIVAVALVCVCLARASVVALDQWQRPGNDADERRPNYARGLGDN